MLTDTLSLLAALLRRLGLVTLLGLKRSQSKYCMYSSSSGVYWRVYWRGPKG